MVLPIDHGSRPDNARSYGSIAALYPKGNSDCGTAAATSIQHATRAAMPYLILFILVFVLGLVVSCVIS
jgi:hypothetical protein